VRIQRYLLAGVIVAAAATASLAAEEAAEKATPPEKPAVSADAKYSAIAEKNIFYPRHEAAASPGEAGSAANPQGSSLLLTGVVRSGDDVFVVIQNTGTGESSIVTRGESTGAGEVVEATLASVTISTESGSFRIPVGYYLSGAQGPSEAVAAGAPGTAEATAPAAQGGEGFAGRRGFFGRGRRDQSGDQGGGQSGDQGGPSNGSNGGPGAPPGGGFRGRPTQEQMDAFRNMTPEQQDQMRQSFRQRRGRRSDTEEQNQ
jgi:hypothetical protein